MGEIIKPTVAWFMRYAPEKIDDIVFPISDIDYKKIVQNWITNEFIDGNVLFIGPPGTGKTVTSHLLIKSIVKSQSDLFIMETRSVQEIDDRLKPWLRKAPIKSKQKIVYIEEMDKMSKQAMTELKNGLLEKYQSTTAFIGCTNHPNSIEKALRTRFNYQLDFNANNIEGIKNRVNFILTNEGAKFNPEELDEFIKNNYKKGIRDIINFLQKSFISNDGTIDFEEVNSSLNIEEDICQLILNMFKTSMSTGPNDKRLCYERPLDSIIADEWTKIVNILHNNYDINHIQILEHLYDMTNFIPIKMICARYIDSIEYKRYPHIHIISCISECLRCISEVTS